MLAPKPKPKSDIDNEDEMTFLRPVMKNGSSDIQVLLGNLNVCLYCNEMLQ